MTFFRRERQLTALIRTADPVAAKPAHKPRYTPLVAACALLLVVYLVPLRGDIPPPLRRRPPSPETLVPRGEGGQLRNSLSNPLPADTRVPSGCLASEGDRGKGGKRGGSEERARRGDGPKGPGDGSTRRHARPLRKRARRAPVRLVASEPRAPEPQGGMIVIAVRPMTPEELYQELNTP